jgi:hypothetical protein
LYGRTFLRSRARCDADEALTLVHGNSLGFRGVSGASLLRECPFVADFVAKLFCPSERVRLIQDQASMRNVDWQRRDLVNLQFHYLGFVRAWSDQQLLYFF